MSIDVDALCAAAMQRIRKDIERRIQVAQGRNVHTANRSAGQLYSKRGRYGKQKTVSF